MKKAKLLLTAFTLVAMYTACNQAPADPAVIQAKVDSIASEKIKTMESQAIAECETRMAVEVKSKTDSLVNAAKMANAAN